MKNNTEAKEAIKSKIFKLLFAVKETENILNQYYINLRVEFDSILYKGGSNNPEENFTRKIGKKIESIFEEENKSWSNAYQIEQYLSHICDNETLETDLKRCLVIYKGHFSDESYLHYKSELKEIGSDKNNIEGKRSVLLRMQSELHSFFIKRSECRYFCFLTRIRVSFISITGIALFLFSLIFSTSFCFISTQAEMILISFSSGFMGASYSMIITLKDQLAIAPLEILKIIHRTSYIIKRVFIGAGAALLVYFLIQSELLNHIISEDLLPILPVMEIDDYPNISVLIIWSFVAGFSEMFVPNLLTKVENRISVNKP